MPKRLKPIEKLAREICWREIARPSGKTPGRTKAAYWSALPEGARQMHLSRARWWLAMYRKLPVDLINGVEDA